MVQGEQLFDREMLRSEQEPVPGLLLKSGREICISGFKEVSKKDQNRALKWRVRSESDNNLKGLVRSDPERTSKKGYDCNQWFQGEEQSHLRKMVKKSSFVHLLPYTIRKKGVCWKI